MDEDLGIAFLAWLVRKQTWEEEHTAAGTCMDEAVGVAQAVHS